MSQRDVAREALRDLRVGGDAQSEAPRSAGTH